LSLGNVGLCSSGGPPHQYRGSRRTRQKDDLAGKVRDCLGGTIFCLGALPGGPGSQFRLEWECSSAQECSSVQKADRAGARSSHTYNPTHCAAGSRGQGRAQARKNANGRKVLEPSGANLSPAQPVNLETRTKESSVMAQMQSAKPARKVWVGSLVGATITIVIWIIESVGNTKVPSTIAVAMSTLLTGIVSYLVPPADTDQVTT